MKNLVILHSEHNSFRLPAHDGNLSCAKKVLGVIESALGTHITNYRRCCFRE